MNTFTKRPLLLLAFIAFSAWACFSFVSCQKSDPNPYSTPEAGITPTVVPTYTSTTTHDSNPPPPPPDTTPSFKASVNGSSIITFTPSKNIAGSYTMLKGTSTYYTIILKFLSSTGPGSYSIGFEPGLTETIINGSTNYIADTYWGGGTLKIDSISSRGKYYGSFSFSAEDTTNITNFLDVTQGSFYHL